MNSYLKSYFLFLKIALGEFPYYFPSLYSGARLLPFSPLFLYIHSLILSRSFDGDLDGLSAAWDLPLAYGSGTESTRCWAWFCPQDFIIDLGFPPEEGATFIKITSIIQAALFISLAGSGQDVCNLTLPLDPMGEKRDSYPSVGEAASGANTTGRWSEDAVSTQG